MMLWMGILPDSLPGQPSLALAGERRVAAVEFSSLRSVRELSDGRVLAADARERRLWIVDFDRGTARVVSREGDGPGEFRSLSQLVALGGDTTAIVDSQARRWILLHRDRLLDPVAPERALLLTQLEPPIRGVDRAGRILHLVPLWFRLATPFRRVFDADSTGAVLLSADGRRSDTLLRLRARGSERGTATRGGTTYRLHNPLGVEEQPLLFSDGWIAIARRDPDRVDWRLPNGSVVRGAPLPVPTRRATADERNAAIRREWSRLTGPPLSETDFRAWPDQLPAFSNDALFPLADGRVAVRVLPDAASRRDEYLIVDREGKSVSRVLVSPSERIVGFGLKHVYLAARDADDIERLFRHAFALP